MSTKAPHYLMKNVSGQSAPHHESIKQLWETKWKPHAQMGVYPFMFGTAKDFVPIINNMSERALGEPYNWDEYAESFFPKARELVLKAELAEQKGNLAEAAEYYLRASAVYRIARFPMPRSPKQYEAWDLNKQTFFKGIKLTDPEIHFIDVPFHKAIQDEGKVIPIIHGKPSSATSKSPVPLVIIITGLDGYRTELAVWIEGWKKLNVATAILEIPGTGDCPASSYDPNSPDRLFTSLLDWIDSRDYIDNSQICAWGFSTGGYYAIRLAYTHHDRLAGVVSHGGGSHYMFEREWLKQSDGLEYPFDLSKCLCKKFGYGDDMEKFFKEASNRFSLLTTGILDGQKCAKLLLVNGSQDEIFPIEDYYLALEHGPPKFARFIPNRKHMGEPESFIIILSWIYELFGIKASPKDQLGLLPTKCHYP